jgi:flagellar protein FliO/FliZ
MRQTLQTLFGFELSTGLRWIIAFAIVLILVALFAFLLRRITGGRLRARGQGGGRARQPRLGVVDIHDLDRQRQLVLIRRDNVEHLVMIGGASDVVVETNILRGGTRVAVPAQAEFQTSERPLAVDPALSSDAFRADIPEEPRRTSAGVSQPLGPQPEALPPLPHRSPPPPRAEPVATPTGASAANVAAAAAGAAVSSATPAPNFGRSQAPAPSASSGELDDMTRQLEEALKRPFSAVRPANAPAEPAAPQETPKLSPAPSTPPAPPAPPVAKQDPPKQDLPKQDLAPPALTPVPTAPPPVFGRPVGVPPDVAAELEMALGLKPEPDGAKAKSAPPVEAPRKPEPPKPADAPKSASEPSQDSGKRGEPSPAEQPEVKPAAPKPAGPDTKAEAEDEGDDGAPTKGADSDKSEPDKAPASKKSAEAEAPEKKGEAKPEDKPAQIDPFSVDAIEAEFARLLGRDPKPKS